MLHMDLSAIQIHWNYIQNNSDNKTKQFRKMRSQH